MAPIKVSAYLYGMLDIHFIEGRDCIAETPLESNAPKLLKGVLHALESTVGLDKQCNDCYCIASLGSARIARSSIVRDPNPKWNERLRVFCAHEVTDVKISVKDNNDIGATFIGDVTFPVQQILTGQVFEGWFDLLDKHGKKNKHKSALHLRISFFPAQMDISYGRGIGDGSRIPAIVHTFFPLRRGCNVRLFQDAHFEDYSRPPIVLTGGKPYEHCKDWEELFRDIENAKHVIYISGWSVNHDITLIRDPRSTNKSGVGVSLGDLLVRKSEEGVTVLLMVWDDKFSRDIPFLKNGVMGTGDEKTEEFFKNTKVKCFLCPREPDDSLSIVQGFKIGNMFTHHQKTAVMDAPYTEYEHEKRRLIGYVGGIDVCKGRYDSSKHSLFRTLNTDHKNDFYQGCLSGASLETGGPRQPWHDIHSRVEGPIAWDLLYNFEQRWLKQADKTKEALLPISDHPEILNPTPVVADNDPSVWSVQLLRSIDSGSVMGFPKTSEEASEAGLVPGKGNVVDRSCQDAYIQAIRRAKNYIYIENQYFLGSSHLWDSDHEASCTHLIPAEIMLKIINKIEVGERFSAYIVIPLYPEGDPTSGSVQAILYWQRKTMAMMYSTIAKALKENGRYDENPRDYLSFFFIGNREAPQDGELTPTKPPESGSYHYYAQLNRRFMIYVHSKLMIVDDEFIIVGSANINQRSMDGARDSELAIAAFQDHHTMDTSWTHGLPRGEIHGFRLSLWAEHLGFIEPTLIEPQSLKCIRLVNSVASRHWEDFIGEEVVDMKGHLMPYPISIDDDGNVSSLPGFDLIPDSKAPIAGTKSNVLPEILTT